MRRAWELCLFAVAFTSAVAPGVIRRLNDAAAEAADPNAAVAVAVDSGEAAVARTSLRRRVDGILEEDSAAAGIGFEHARVRPLVRSLLKDWAKGVVNSRQVQEYANGARLQGASGVDALAFAGASGRHPANIHRALLNYFGRPPGAPELSYFAIPTKHSSRTLHPFLLPHLWFRSLFNHRRDAFDKYIRGAQNAALEFWENMQCTPFVQRHPTLRRSDFWRALHVELPHGEALCGQVPYGEVLYGPASDGQILYAQLL